MPSIMEETPNQILWESFSVPVMHPVPPMVPDDDVKMIMSGQPPSMSVIVEEREEDILKETSKVQPLQRKHRPPAMPPILEETAEDLMYENFTAQALKGKYRHLHCHASLKRPKPDSVGEL
jgi:hypothetical protein